MPWKENQNRNLGPLLMILVVLVVAVVWYIYGRGGSLPGLPSKFPAVEKEVIVARAKPGELITGFSPELIITQDSKIKESYVSTANNPDPGLPKIEHLTTIYQTEATTADIYGGYIAYMNENGFKPNSSISGDAYIVGQSGSTTIRVLVYPGGTGREVKVEVIEPVIQ